MHTCSRPSEIENDLDMYLKISKIVFLILLQHLVIVRSQSPCPDFFRYYRNITTGEIMGTVEIPSPPVGIPLHLKVILSVATVLPTNYVGRIELVKSREESIEDIFRRMPLFYKIYFPLRYPVPVLVSIHFNGMQLCMGQPAIAMIVTNLILEHNLYPSFPISTLPQISLPNVRPGIPKPSIPYPQNIYQEPELKPPVLHYHPFATMPPPEIKDHFIDSKIDDESFTYSKPSEESCGLTSGYNPLDPIYHRMLTRDWPWVAAIFLFQDKIEFRCAASLISDRFALTAAHCLLEQDERIPAHYLAVALGRNNLSDWDEPGSITVGLKKYYIHPDFRKSLVADSDIAIIEFDKSVSFTGMIRPICLWIGAIDLNQIVGNTGFVAGWGRELDGKSSLSKPRLTRVPIVSQENCLRSNTAFFRITSSRTFCAGDRHGNGLCNTDSGTGLFMFHASTGRYHLRGIVSLSMLDKSLTLCDPNEFVIYVDVAKYLYWIHTTTQQ